MIALAALDPRRHPLVLLATVAVALALGQPPALAAPGWKWPVSGEVITPYRNGSDPYAGGQHRRIDVAAPSGTPVVAATAGTVRFVGVAGSSGLTVSVRTADGRYDTSYLHLSAAQVAGGQAVRAGERLGAVGTSGTRSTVAPHLHFGVREADSRHAYRDPLDFLAPPAARPAPEHPRVPVTAPVGRPVRVGPAPRPVRTQLRGRAPQRAPRPARVPSPRRIRMPAGRRVRVPSGGTAPLPGLSPAPRTAPVGSGKRVPARVRRPGHVPSTGPAPVAEPLRALEPGRARRPAPAPGGAPSLGWALACLGLLLAAASLGPPGARADRSERRRVVLGSILRPLVGRR